MQDNFMFFAIRAYRGLLFLAFASTMVGCSKENSIRGWQEEVKLNDGRVIVIQQKENCSQGYTGTNYANCIARENWVTFTLPEFSSVPIVWHEKLFPIILNIDRGRLYVVGYPRTGRELRELGDPRPPYIGFVWDDAQWRRIPFTEIPVEIYDTNIYLGDWFPGSAVLSVARKEGSEDGMRGSPKTVSFLKRIDPQLKQ